MASCAPRAIFLCGDETGCALWRAWGPCTELKRQGFVADWAPINGCPECGMESRPEELRGEYDWWVCPRCHYRSRGGEAMEKVLDQLVWGHYDVVVTPRIVWPIEGDGDRWIREIHRLGIAWVYEFDDDVLSPSITRRQIRLFESERLKGAEQLERERVQRVKLIRQADGVTVSSRRLQTVAEMYTDRPVHVVPNAIDTDWFRETLRGCRRVVPPLTIGWAGGTREDADLKPMITAWGILAARYPDLHFVVQGHISKALADAVPQQQRTTLPWLPLEEYPRALLNIDIGCCSVAPLLFNTSKTPIKLWEMTMAGAVCVVSPTLYGPYVEDGEDGLIAETPEEWVEALERLVLDATLRRRLYRNQRRRIAEYHSLKKNWWRWLDAWDDILTTFRAKPRILIPA